MFFSYLAQLTDERHSIFFKPFLSLEAILRILLAKKKY